jgi:hypothetical protein
VAGPVRRPESRRRQRLKKLEGENAPAEAGSWPTRSSRSSRCRSWAGKLASPARRRRAVRAPPPGVRGLPAVGVPAGRAAPLYPTPPTGRAGSRPSSGQRVTPVQPGRSKVGLSTRAHPKLRQGWMINRKAIQRLWREEGLRVTTTRQTPAAGHLQLSSRPAGGRAPEPRMGIGLPVRPDPRRQEVEAAQHRGRAPAKPWPSRSLAGSTRMPP